MNYFQFNSCPSNIHLGYKPKSSINKRFNRKAARSLPVNTEIFGRAQIWLTTGRQSGPGANLVKASHPALGEEVFFTANTQRGTPTAILADLGTSQIAQTSSQPLELLSVSVRDTWYNLLPNIPVVFTIEEGDASFADLPGATASTNPNGTDPSKPAQRLIVTTDKNGMAAVRTFIGTTAGLIRIKAQALKTDTTNPDTPANLLGNATFLITAKAAQDGPASFTGAVYDDKSRPLAGIKVSIGRTNLVSTTNAQGQFQLDNIPPGRIDLFVDGRTFNPSLNPNTAQYPSLHFEAYAVPGQANQLAHPIYLPPLLTSSAKTVGGNEDVIVTIPGIAGFQMKVKANSVTFPDGSRVGTLVVSPVTADKLPMAPPGGIGKFGVPAWTIQPAGTRFDPPIEVTLPNYEGQQPGDNIAVVQWDHDLSQYVAMGRATVSEDGSVLVCDSGSGVSKAGWGGAGGGGGGGGGPAPDGPKCGSGGPPKCKDCQTVDSSGACPTCVADATKNDKKCDGDACKRCQGGSCLEKFSKDKGTELTTISFTTQIVIAATTAKGNFLGYRDQLGHPAEWTFDLQPYCTAEGNWKFALSKADIKTKIIRPSSPPYIELTDSRINAITATSVISTCIKYRSVEFDLKWSASSHFSPGGPASNPEIQALQAKGWGALDGNIYDRWEEVEAHERNHFSRFQTYVRTGWSAFMAAINAMQTPIQDGDTPAAARNRVRSRLDDAVTVLQERAKLAQTPHDAFGDHDPPGEFYGVSVNAMAGTWALLNSLRAAKSCPPP